MSLNWGLDLYTTISNCPYGCWKNWCIWQCKGKDILREEIQKKNLLFILKNQIIKIIQNINDPCHIDPSSDLSLLGWEDNINQIGKEKSKLVSLLFWINLDWINWDKLKNLWTQIKQIWWNILWYELLARWSEWFIEKKLSYKFGKIKYIEPVNKDLDIPSLWEINRDFKKQVELASVILWSLVKWLDKLSWEDISNFWDIIIKVWYRLKILEITKKTLEIKGWLL